MTVRAVTFDYWDTLYAYGTLPERVAVRRKAVHRMLGAIGHDISEDDLAVLYSAATEEAIRWWRAQRGYTAQERIRWMLEQLAIERPADCEHVARAVRAVDDALLDYPPALLPGAADTVHAVAGAFGLGIVSDTGFASGTAQNRILERDGLRDSFVVTVYSVDIGHAKPHPEPFAAAVRALGVAPAEIVHVGDNERTDVLGALAAGMRAVRIDILRESGPSAAEFVARSHEELAGYLLTLRERAPRGA